MNTIINIILFILILGVLVFVHELGHFLTAKKSGVFIHEFSIGMGPLIKQITGKDGIKYSIRALPIGGYVQMAGEIYEDDDTKKIPKNKFMCNKKWYQRLIILCAGVFNNFLLAFILLFFISLIWGAASLKPVIYDVTPNKPMAKAGVVAGDTITSINGKRVKTWDRAQLLLLLKDKDNTYEIGIKHKDGSTDIYNITPLQEITKFIDPDQDGIYNIATTIDIDEDLDEKSDYQVSALLKDKEKNIYIDNEGKEYIDENNDWIYTLVLTEEPKEEEVTVSEEKELSKESFKIDVDSDDDGKKDTTIDAVYDEDGNIIQKDATEGREFGVIIQAEEMKGNRFINAIKYAFQKFFSIVDQMYLTLGGLFTGKISINQLSGPVGIYTVVGETRKAGIASILFLTAYLSINLGVMNILPIPALDGGHVLFLVIEMITRKKVNAKVESITTTIFFILLFALMIYITIHDVITLIL